MAAASGASAPLGQVLAQSETTFTLTATATEQGAFGNTSSASASETVAVGAAAAGGTPQLPNLFSNYPVRPPWQVAGVDYYVGLPAGTKLKDPSAPGALPAGASIDGYLIYVAGNNVTLSGFDFSLHGGYGIYVAGASNTTITEDHFLGTSQSGILVNISATSSNTTITHNTINGGGSSGDFVDGELIFNAGQGLTVQYNWIFNAPQHYVSVVNGGALTYSYNLLENGGWVTGAHLNYLQWGGGTATSPEVEYNTVVQDVTLPNSEINPGQIFQMYDNSSGAISEGVIANNTIITVPSGSSMAASYILDAGSSSPPSPFTGTIDNNYIDATGAYGAFYPGLSGFTYSRNINLVPGQINLTLVAAVLPTSRSVEIGTPATAFATMINAGPADAATCTIAPATSIPASFVFQTTDPVTNALAGTANTPANIAAGQAGTFVIALTPTAAFAPTNVAFTFTCANAPSPAASIVGVDTLNLSGSATPVPDVVALAASADPGYVDIPGITGTGGFAVATVNLGSTAQITIGANTGAANLPVTPLLCQTDPTNGACLAPPAATVSTSIASNATPTFGVFVTGIAAVADMPGVNRVFMTFTDSSGLLRGETSVAVRTQ
jgi:hypothetical protein